MSTKIEPPDFNKLFELAEKIGELTRARNRLDTEIKFKESEVVNTVMSDPKYLQNGKQPSMSFIESTYKYAGIENEILALRYKLVDAVADLEQARLTFEVLKMQFDYYRTESANSRTVQL